MALKITTQIGTNRGITSEAYLRIVNYQISKLGYLQLNTQMFLSEEIASTPIDQIVAGMECFNTDIQNSLKIPLTQTLTRTVTKNILVDEEKEMKIPIMDENGNFTNQFRTETTPLKVQRETEVEEEYQVIDLSIIKNQDIFAFGYAKLKEKLIEIYGAENIVDC
jgi:hypothetical protein